MKKAHNMEINDCPYDWPQLYGRHQDYNKARICMFLWRNRIPANSFENIRLRLESHTGIITCTGTVHPSLPILHCYIQSRDDFTIHCNTNSFHNIWVMKHINRGLTVTYAQCKGREAVLKRNLVYFLPLNRSSLWRWTYLVWYLR